MHIAVLSDITISNIEQPINTTSDGTFLSVVCEKNPQKCCWPKVGGAVAPPAPPEITPLKTVLSVPNSHIPDCLSCHR